MIVTRLRHFMYHHLKNKHSASALIDARYWAFTVSPVIWKYMPGTDSLRVITFAFVALAATGLWPAECLAQKLEQSMQIQKLRVFKGKASPRERKAERVGTPPPSLTQAVKLQMLKGLGVSALLEKSVFTLSPNQPFVADRGSLVFVSPSYVSTGFYGNLAGMMRGSDVSHPQRHLSVFIRSTAPGQVFLIDCSVGLGYPNKTYPTNRYTVLVPGNPGSRQEWSVDKSGQHLIFALESEKADWHEFRIFSSVFSWNFYSCEVAPL